MSEREDTLKILSSHYLPYCMSRSVMEWITLRHKNSDMLWKALQEAYDSGFKHGTEGRQS